MRLPTVMIGAGVVLAANGLLVVYPGARSWQYQGLAALVGLAMIALGLAFGIVRLVGWLRRER